MKKSKKVSKATMWLLDKLSRVFGDTGATLIVTAGYFVLSALGNLCMLYLGIWILTTIGWLPIS